MSNSPIASGVAEDNPQGHSTTETIPAFYRFDFLAERVCREAERRCSGEPAHNQDSPRLALVNRKAQGRLFCAQHLPRDVLH
jgi:hypothetical protein